MQDNPAEEEIKQKILTTDIIYVGGGDTLNMLKIWRQKQVDHYLVEAYKRDIVLSGLSAGSICWFEKNHGDPYPSSNAQGWWDAKQPKGIGLIPAIHCPHYNAEGHEEFENSMREEELPGIAIEDHCALVVQNDQYKVLRTNPNSKAYVLKNTKGYVTKNEITASTFRPLDEIL